MFIDANEIDKYRKHWEIEKHWKLRKDFILAHHDHIDEDRLLCLAQCYANMEILKNGFVYKIIAVFFIIFFGFILDMIKDL